MIVRCDRYDPDPDLDPQLRATAQDLAHALARLLAVARAAPAPAAPAGGENIEKLLTFTEAARRLGIDRRAVAALVARGALKAVAVGTRRRIQAGALARLGETATSMELQPLRPARARRRAARAN